MRYMSPRRRREQKTRAQLREQKTVAGCTAKIPGVCTGGPLEVNEKIRRSQWRAGYLVPENCEAHCHACHQHITLNPEWATANGFQQPSTERPTCEVGDCGAGADTLVEDDGAVAWVCRRHQPVVDTAVAMGLLILRDQP
jgi:hypothetical protein